MKNLLITILFLLPLISFGSLGLGSFEAVVEQDDPKINQQDNAGNKQGKWVFLGKDQPEKGYPKDGKISEGTYKDDRKNGLWTMYYKDGMTPKTEGNFVDNRPNGPFIRYHQNGAIKEMGTFSSRKYKDSLQRFNEKGVKIYEASYNGNGSESGKVTYYHDNGKPEFEYVAKDGVPTGKAVRYWPNGDVKEEITYAEDGSIKSTTGQIDMVNPTEKVEEVGKGNVKIAPKPSNANNFEPNGYNKIYNDDKELWQEGEFKNGLLFDGRLYVYDEDGLLLKVEVYKKGKYHSDGQL